MQYHPTLSRDLQYPAVAGFRRVLVWGPAAQGSPLVHPDGLQFFLWGTAARAVRLGYNVLALDADTSLHYDVYAWLKVRGGAGVAGAFHLGATQGSRCLRVSSSLHLNLECPPTQDVRAWALLLWHTWRAPPLPLYQCKAGAAPCGGGLTQPVLRAAQAPPYADHTWVYQDESMNGGAFLVNSGIM